MRSIGSRLMLAAVLGAVSLQVSAQPVFPLRILARFDNVSRDELLRTGVITGDDYRPGNLISFVSDTAWVILTPAQRDTILPRGLRYEAVLEDLDTLKLIRRAMYGPHLHLEAP